MILPADRDPRQVLAILDVERGTPVDEVVARLPDYEEPVQICRVSECGLGVIERGQKLHDWVRATHGVGRLVSRIHDLVPMDGRGVELYVSGQAPLPLFALLGNKLKRWKHPLTIVQRRDETWSLVRLQPAVPQDGKPMFDVQRGLDVVTQRHLPRVNLAISTRGLLHDRAAINRYVQKQGEPPGPLIELGTSELRLWAGQEGMQVEQELRHWLALIQAATPELTLLLSGAPALGFCVGRALTLEGDSVRIIIPEHESRGEFRHALDLPLFEQPMAETKVSIFVAYSSDQPPRSLEHHLRAAGFEVYTKESVVPGQALERELEQFLEKSDIILPLLSAEFASSPLGNRVFQLAAQGKKVIPVLWSDFFLERSSWGELLILLRERPFSSSDDQDEALKRITQKVDQAAERVRAAQPIITLPRIKKVDTRSILEVLDQIERRLKRLPLLRFTLRQRYDIWWKPLVSFLDSASPSPGIEKRLRHHSQKHWEELRPGENPDEELLPEDPLQFVLGHFSTDDAAKMWLYLGLTLVGPVLPFPLHDLAHQEVNLANYLALYQLSDSEKLRIELVRKLHHHGCPGVLATLHRSQVTPADVELAIRLLEDFRSGGPLQMNVSDIATINQPGLLNLIGADAMWRGKLHLARKAYRKARRCAWEDRDNLATWIARNGVWIATSGLSLLRFATRSNPRQILRQEKSRRRSQRTAKASRVDAHYESTLMEARRQLQQDLQRTLAEGGEPEAFAVNTLTLKELLRDYEELGAPPPMRGDIAALLGSALVWQSQAPLKGIRLLGRYGVEERIGHQPFQAPSLHPLRGEFLDVYTEMLRPGRTTGEWLVRLAFGKEHILDLPAALLENATHFYNAALEHFIHIKTDSVAYVSGRSWGSKTVRNIVSEVMDQLVMLAGHLPQGPAWILGWLLRSEPACWETIAPNLYRLCWENWLHLGWIDQPMLESFARRLLELPKAKGQWHFVPDLAMLGYASLLPVMQKSSVANRFMEDLHTRLLNELAIDSQSPYHRNLTFRREVVEWLKNQTDAATDSFMRQRIAAIFGTMESFDTWSNYFDLFASLSESFDLLQPAEWQRLTSLLSKLETQLIESVGCREYAAKSLCTFAARLLRQDQPHLHNLARTLIQKCVPLPELLKAIVIVQAERLGDLAPVVEQAISHCLRGGEASTMPWFYRVELEEGTTSSGPQTLAGIEALHDRLFYQKDFPPRTGWRSWLDPALAHVYGRNIEVAQAAVRVLGLAIHKIPNVVDPMQAVEALLWALSRPDRRVRAKGLDVALRHENWLRQAPSYTSLESALEQTPDTIEKRWLAALAKIPELDSDP